MGLYLGKNKLCSYDVKENVQNSLKMLWDSIATSGKEFYTSTYGHFSPFAKSTVTSMDGWWLPSDTKNVAYMNAMFYNCKNLVSIPMMDTSNVTDMRYMFYSCSSLTSIPQLDTSNVTNMNSMFCSCSSLTSIPQLDTSKVTSMYSMFDSCRSLTSIPELNTSNVTDMRYMFYSCSSLTEIHMTGMKVSFSIAYSTKLTREALVEILNNLASVSSTQTLTMGSTILAKLTDDDKAIATGKGWTLA